MSTEVPPRHYGRTAPRAPRAGFFDREVVTYTGPDAAPPRFAISGAAWVAAKSPCTKSKRGVVVYRRYQQLEGGNEIAIETNAFGYNGPPWIGALGDDPGVEGTCEGSEACRSICSKRCVHAEQRALWAVIDHGMEAVPAHLLRLVHVKIGADGKVMPGKGPSCLECSKIIVERGIGGIWLYELVVMPGFEHLAPPRWRYYTAEAFHRATEVALGIHG